MYELGFRNHKWPSGGVLLGQEKEWKEHCISPDIEIYDNKVMIASWREKLGTIIESQEIANAMTKIFELALIGAKTLDKEGWPRV